MKILLIVALAVAAVVAKPEAEAEAAADAWYGYYGYGRPYGYYGYPKYKTKWVDGYGYANYGHVGKRSAEADPAFAYTIGHPHVYGHPLVYTHPVALPVAYANNVCTNEAGAVVPCASGVAHGSGVYNFADAPVGLHPVLGAVGAAPVAPAAAEADAVVSVEKREAEAEAEADPEAEAAADAWYSYYGRPAYYGGYYGYGGYGYRGYYGLPYGYGYYAHGGRPYSYGWTDGPNNGVGPYEIGRAHV